MGDQKTIERAAWAMREASDRIGLELTYDFCETLTRSVFLAIRDLPGEPGPRYSAGEYSRRNMESFVDDALGVAE